MLVGFVRAKAYQYIHAEEEQQGKLEQFYFRKLEKDRESFPAHLGEKPHGVGNAFRDAAHGDGAIETRARGICQHVHPCPAFFLAYSNTHCFSR